MSLVREFYFLVVELQNFMDTPDALMEASLTDTDEAIPKQQPLLNLLAGRPSSSMREFFLIEGRTGILCGSVVLCSSQISR